MTTLTPVKLEDETAERVRRNHHDAIKELQALPFAGGVVIAGVTLADAVSTPIAHGLGHTPIWCAPSPPRGASATGRIEEVSRDSKLIYLKATGWGATITIDLAVM